MCGGKIFSFVFSFCIFVFGSCSSSFGKDVKQPNVAGAFYPDDPKELSFQIDSMLDGDRPDEVRGDIFALISPHAGYSFSGRVAAFGYKLIKNKDYKTVVVIGPSHYFPFKGVSVYPQGAFRTPLGDLQIDSDFARELLYKDPEIDFKPEAFEKEHSVEVQLPFLQKSLQDFKIVPIVMGDCSFSTCRKLSLLLKEAISGRKDVLVVASTDMYHGYDYTQADLTDNKTLSYLKNMDEGGLYNGLVTGTLQFCGGFPVVSTLILAKELGHNTVNVLEHTNSAQVTGKKIKGTWTVGYSSCVIDRQKGEKNMFDESQRKKLLGIARQSIEAYLKTGKKPAVSETDPLLLAQMGAFVTLNENGDLRGCIGNLIGQEPLYLTVRDMAVESATGDPRFSAVSLKDLSNIEIEISVLSPMKKVNSADEIELGKHGVLIKRGFRSGVFLPQVATETGWTKEEFLSNLCLHKAGIPADAWKDTSTEMYIFSAEVFSENNH